jgi:RND family efflux transporter MFP subunit
VVVAVVLLVVVGLVAIGIWSRVRTTQTLKTNAANASLPRVQAITPQRGPAMRTLVLPGNIEAWYQASIYGQVAGYVAHWYKDYGAVVKAGDVLGTVSAPGLDAELAGAKAQLASTRANYDLAAVTAKRWLALAGTKAVAQEDVDIKVADEKAQKAQVAMAQQNVAKFQAMAAFKNLTAPFDGVVVARNANIGDFVSAAGSQSNERIPSQPLFTVADVHRLRVFASVPQAYADFLRPGLQVSLNLPQQPGKRIPAQFLTTAKAVGPATRSVVTELVLDNPGGVFLPGSFVNVQFEFPSDPNVLIVPEQALLFRAQGMQVALIGPGNKVHLQNVTVGRNLGADVEVTSGLTTQDRLVASPSAGLLEGQQVQIVQTAVGVSAAGAARTPS